MRILKLLARLCETYPFSTVRCLVCSNMMPHAARILLWLCSKPLPNYYIVRYIYSWPFYSSVRKCVDVVTL